MRLALFQANIEFCNVEHRYSFVFGQRRVLAEWNLLVCVQRSIVCLRPYRIQPGAMDYELDDLETQYSTDKTIRTSKVIEFSEHTMPQHLLDLSHLNPPHPGLVAQTPLKATGGDALFPMFLFALSPTWVARRIETKRLTGMKQHC